MAGPLAQKIRAKYPGAYDDLDDATLEKAILAKHPEYADLVEPTPQEPGFVDRALADNPQMPMQQRAMAWLARTVKNNPVESAATVGAILGAPATGGGSVLGPILGAGLGGAGGAGVGLIGKQLATGKPEAAADVVGTMAQQGATQAAGQAAGPLIGGTLQMAGRGLYRAAALPINQLAKYGDLISEGLSKRVPVGKSGLAKAGALADEASAVKSAALKSADARVTQIPRAIAEDARGNLSAEAGKLRRAGMGNRMPEYDAQLEEFVKQNPEGLAPSALDDIKRTWDDASGGAYKKIRGKEPLNAQERFTVEMGQAASRAQESAVPNYRGLNKDVMNAQGLKRMIGRRVNPGSSGGNQGLENAMTLIGGVHALPARLLMLPPVLSRLGIAANDVGAAARPSLPSLYRAALMALLGSDEQPDQ